MSESSRHSYQMYLSFLNQARQHEQAGAETAWKLYLHAARCLLACVLVRLCWPLQVC